MPSRSPAPMPWRPAPTLILDFDETLVDKDSSEWVADQLGAGSLFDDLRRRQAMPWHQAMNVVLHTLHSQGTTIAHIRHALSGLPLPAETGPALKAAHSLGFQLHILSDANTFFIESVLAHHGLDSLFTHIYSNPAWIDAKGCLRYSDFHGDSLPPHNCPLCPPNMCKGSVLDTICTNIGDPAAVRIIYAGDGYGDLCPSLRLSERDYLLPRQGYTLSSLVQQYHVRASLHPWNSLASTLQDTLPDFVKCSSGFRADEARASFLGVFCLLCQVDCNTLCRGSTVASRSSLPTKSHDVRKADFSLRRHPFTNFTASRSLLAYEYKGQHRKTTPLSKTACLWMSSKRPFWHLQASALVAPPVSGHAVQPDRVFRSLRFSGVC